MTDIHYDLRASERDINVSLKEVIDCGWLVEKRRRFLSKRKKDIVYIAYDDKVHVLSSDLKKRITVVPYSRRKWKLI